MGDDDYEQIDELEQLFRANLDGERAVLAAMLASNDAVWTVQRILRPEDFTDGRNATLASTIIRLVQAGGTADPVTVSEEIERRGLATQAGGIAYLFSLERLGHSDVEHYAEIVKDRAVRRGLRNAADSIAAIADDRDLETAAAVDRAQAVLEAATNRSARRIAPIGDDVATYLENLDTQAQHYGSPWPALDSLTGGFAPGRLYVIAARPGSGKTIMGVQIADALTRYGAVAYSSLEMERSEILGRLFSARGNVNLAEFNGARVSDWGWRRIAEQRASIADLPLYVDDGAEQYVTDVVAHARAVARRQPLAGIVVDYLGLMQTPNDKRPRWEHFSEISRALKRAAKTLRVPVIALQQLGRGGSESGRIRPPVLEDIRDSGTIEQDADVVILLHRAHADGKNAPETLTVHAAKNRHGPTEEFHLGWHGDTARLTPLQNAQLPIPPEEPQ